MAREKRVLQSQTQRPEDYGSIAFKIERIIIFILILFPNYTSLCVAFFHLSNLYYIGAHGLIKTPVYGQCSFWLERFATILVTVQYTFFNQFNFWYTAVAYFGVSNMLYMAHQKKLSKKVLLPGSSFYAPNPTEGRGYYFWFRMAVFLLAFLPLNSVLDSVIRNFLCILVASFAVPAVLVNYIKPENLLPKNLSYNSPRTQSTRILNSKDPEDRFWFERAVTILLLIAYGMNETASRGYLAACLFAVTNAIYFLNFFERILDKFISPDAENTKAEAKDESPSKESSEQPNTKAKAVKDKSTSKESSSSEEAKAEAVKDEFKSKEVSEDQEAIKAEAKYKPPSEEALKGDQTSTVKKPHTVFPHQIMSSRTASPSSELSQLQFQQQLRQMQSPAVMDPLLGQNQLQFQQRLGKMESLAAMTPLVGQSRPQFQKQSRQMQSPAWVMTSGAYYDVPVFNHAQAKEVEKLRQVKTKWEAERKGLTLKHEEVKKERLTPELKEKRQCSAKLENENEKTVLIANNEALRRQLDGLEEEVEKLKGELRKLKAASEHDQRIVTELEQRGEEWIEEKKWLVEELGELKEDRKAEKSEKARLKEMLETAEGRYEYYLSVVDDFVEKSKKWDAERERLTLELCKAAERCELYKSLLREGGYGTPKFSSF